MSRNLCCSALVLRTRASGEANREVWLLGAETGLIRATLFGGPKSRLRSYASPFHSGRAWIYCEPVKDSRKLTDFDVSSWRPGIRELYERAMAADAIARMVLDSHGGGGGWADALFLAEAALDALALADGETCPCILLWFLWQWADFLGIQPEFAQCAMCGRPLPADGILQFSPREGGVICGACRSPGGGSLIEVGPGCRSWLDAAHLLSPAQLGRHALDAKSFREAKALTASMFSCSLGKRVSAWEW